MPALICGWWSLKKKQWSETEHELQRRLGIIVEQGRLTPKQARLLQEAVQALIDDRAIEIIPRSVYEQQENGSAATCAPDPTSPVFVFDAWRFDPKSCEPDPSR